MPEPLPVNLYNQRDQKEVHDAYERCLDLENRHAQVLLRGHLPVLVCARLLGYLLRQAPTDEGRKILALEIMRCGDDKALQSLASIYDTRFRRVCEFTAC